MICYNLTFNRNPYNKETGIPQWWPWYVSERGKLVANETDNDHVLYTLPIYIKEQYEQEFDEFIECNLKDYIVSNEKYKL